MNPWLCLLLVLNCSVAMAFSEACPCSTEPAFKKAYKKSDVVFEGSVLNRKYVIVTDIGTYMVDSLRVRKKTTSIKQIIVRYEIGIHQNWKGRINKNRNILIYTGMEGEDCGYPFELNKSYTVYAQKRAYLPYANDIYPIREEAYWVQQCSRTTEDIQKETLIIRKNILKPADEL